MRGASIRQAVVVLAALAFLPSSAGASTGYPAEIQSQLQLSYTPACSICHAGGDTDGGTVTTEFGTAMVSRGLVGGNNLPSLDGALAALEGEKSVYIIYLQDDVDPNNPSSSTIPGITYGCFNATGQGPAPGGLGLLVVGLILVFLVRPRGRPSSSKEMPPQA
jgi:MYXO-CTERM domain-containing protein